VAFERVKDGSAAAKKKVEPRDKPVAKSDGRGAPAAPKEEP
jgi:hypothetical protein